MSDDEIRQLIIHADTPQSVEDCCEKVHGQPRMFMVPMQVKSALTRGLVVCLSGEIVDSARIYSAKIQLTDAGRGFCGIAAGKKKDKFLF